MKRLGWQFWLGVSLLLLSVAFYFIHYLIFNDTHHIFIYLIGDFAFVFIEVLLVTLIIHRLLEQKEKKTRLEKLNMIIGVFFSEVGTSLLGIFSKMNPKTELIKDEFIAEEESAKNGLLKISKWLSGHKHGVDKAKIDWEIIRTFLLDKRFFLLRLLENSNLLEHESFSDMLWAVFHLTEELSVRKNFKLLPDEDQKHLIKDTERVYLLLADQWLNYMKHLKKSYPYLFSMAIRTNPFNNNASPVVLKECD